MVKLYVYQRIILERIYDLFIVNASFVYIVYLLVFLKLRKTFSDKAGPQAQAALF